jgi:hypothetical protein
MTESRGMGGGSRGCGLRGRWAGLNPTFCLAIPIPALGSRPFRTKGENDPTPSVDSFSLPVLGIPLYKKDHFRFNTSK